MQKMVPSSLYLMQMELPSWDCGSEWKLYFNYRADDFGAAPDGRTFLGRGLLIASADFPFDAG